MSVKKEVSGRRSVAVEVKVAGTPEEVWRAIATRSGVSSWFVPADVEEREDGAVVCGFARELSRALRSLHGIRRAGSRRKAATLGRVRQCCAPSGAWKHARAVGTSNWRASKPVGRASSASFWLLIADSR